MKFNFVETENFKHLRSPNSNYDFNKKTGYTEMWGKTREEDIIYSDVGPQILDLEISTICNGYKNNGRCHFCSPPGTKINTPSGMKNIEDIQVGDYVYSARQDMTNFGDVVVNQVLELYKHDYSGDLIKIKTKSNEILLTPDHIVILNDFSEKPAGDLTLYDIMISVDGNLDALYYSDIVEISRVPYSGPVYNFHCSPDEKYFSENLLVHNCYKNEANPESQDQNMSLETFKQILDSMAVDCLEIVLENGKTIYVTEDVLVVTKRGIVKAKELVELDDISKVIIDEETPTE